MRRKDREVYRPGEAFAGEFRRAEAEIVGANGMVCEIRDQENRRNAARRKHTGAVTRDLAGSNKIETTDEKNAAESVQSGVKMRKDR